LESLMSGKTPESKHLLARQRRWLIRVSCLRSEFKVKYTIV
jgi:hypothetical protein